MSKTKRTLNFSEETNDIMEQLTPKQALEILEQATSALTANRAVHMQILQALEVLRKNLIPS